MKNKADTIKIKDDRQKTIVKAKENLRKMQEEIAPFINRRKTIANPTIGKWYSTS